jgi:hypothetical protein
MPIADAALGESDTMTCRTPKVRHRTDSSCGELRETEVRYRQFRTQCFWSAAVLRRFFNDNHCQEITSSEFVKLALPPLVPIA